ncbi:MAG: low specificity L-threonine aldolase [Zymomonas mobilis subsp. pomaceae]|uniref:Aromatic amino acid beta-eliminating lyase/threonine aldolase n=1 Tax=Zymomonas mobilis subsp. pomaceae (strain ATCC 29192 / DSM 22645 / JCM 10191 / CCUG 17912 / NBRC 13757 / NCIMB 11200 / NRRL B-4491 / Barker I) TaxID=579138 RepID=F8ESU8_ZYMMT|nr:low specificity L-threonine aldolase [Zymomonas mobilis]AEI36914.1 aromatic amino acid beta-eliminating lyase/threonine aldolase [Zymomonas mobilis subsp. pomaceae ATCC 29192]MDX5948287.1 low specificity L-threonine aldolase [Zymomonas mobilis subsp. pomaceae]GEB89041.1 L-threonine aldolase [Zymomonas mobilis subsp. pomaceae]
MQTIRFFSDNAATVAAPVMDAIIAANHSDMAYDADQWSLKLDAIFSELFETEVTAHWTVTGTASNALAMAAICPPFGGVLCSQDAHVQTDEGGAPEFYTHGSKLLLVPGEAAKFTPQSLRDRAAAISDSVHMVQPHAVTITNSTELGQVYTPEETAAIGAVAREKGWHFHLDGARFANAIASLNCSVADLTWKAGVDLMSFGFTKNGAMAAEALVFFNRDLAADNKRRRKRAGHLLSKGRFISAQIEAMLKNDLWLDLARSSNGVAARIAAAIDPKRLVYPVQANEIFLYISQEERAELRAKGFVFYDWGHDKIRLVASWDQPDHEVVALIEALQAL